MALQEQLVESFERAVVDESHRQTFLDELVENNPSPYVKDVVYNPFPVDFVENMTIMSTDPSFLAKLFVKKTKSTVIVYPIAFIQHIDHYNLDDFLSTLEDHEYFHAREVYECPSKVLVPFWQTAESMQKYLFDLVFEQYQEFKQHSGNSLIHSSLWELGESLLESTFGRYDVIFFDMVAFHLERELRAIENQIQNFPRRNCSDEYQTVFIMERISYIQQLRFLKLGKHKLLP
ncbi:hypothetical protein GOV03_03385 [Candidatus Woesearchaeota archaeon]|nr:hypothetical protein [Candidatus Woesearchaeota archaeon]